MRKFLGSIASVLLLVGFSLTASANIWVTSGSGDTNLYEVDMTGAIVQTVGDTGQMFTGLAYNSATGMLIGTTSPASANPSNVYSIDPATGNATLIGPHGIDRAITDLTFDSDGTLYGWLEPGNDDLVTIDLADGAATVIGDSPGSAGRGIEFTPSGMVALFDASLATLLDPATGLATGDTIPLTGSGNVNGSALIEDGTVLAINASGRDGARALISVDFATGDVATLGTISITNASGIAATNSFIGGAPAAPVPSIGSFGLFLLILLAAAIGVYTVRRRIA